MRNIKESNDSDLPFVSREEVHIAISSYGYALLSCMDKITWLCAPVLLKTPNVMKDVDSGT